MRIDKIRPCRCNSEFTGLTKQRFGEFHEAYLPTLRHSPQAYSRFPCPHEDPRWSCSSECASFPWSQGSVRLIATGFRTDLHLTADVNRCRFARSMRLLKKDDFSSVFSLRRSAGDAFFQVLAAPNGLPHARLGLVVGRKTDRRAVARNYIKRLIREHFRCHADELAGLDLVVRSRRSFGRREGGQARASLTALWGRVQKWRA